MFKKFDYGPKKNKEKYGQEKAPVIDVSQIRDVPVAMFVGKYDGLSNIKDNRWLKSQINASLVSYTELDYSHASFVIGSNFTFF